MVLSTRGSKVGQGELPEVISVTTGADTVVELSDEFTWLDRGGSPVAEGIGIGSNGA